MKTQKTNRYASSRWAFFLVLTLSNLLSINAFAGELDCRVSVLTPNIQGVDQTVFTQLQQDITKYMNDTRWTNDQFDIRERIKCSLTFTITSLPAPDRFEGTVQIQTIRPVFNSTFETVTLNYNDKTAKFNYVPFQQFIFSEVTYVNNLLSLLNFYAYIILGTDYDTFSQDGGIPYYQKAQNTLNLALQSNESGWSAMDGQQSRYWLIENLLNNSYKALHKVNYTYHRLGLDVMEKDVNTGRVAILQALTELQKLYASNPNVYYVQVFLDAKANELVNVFRKAFPEDKTKFLQVVQLVDAANSTLYQQVMKEEN